MLPICYETSPVPLTRITIDNICRHIHIKIISSLWQWTYRSVLSRGVYRLPASDHLWQRTHWFREKKQNNPSILSTPNIVGKGTSPKPHITNKRSIISDTPCPFKNPSLVIRDHWDITPRTLIKWEIRMPKRKRPKDRSADCINWKIFQIYKLNMVSVKVKWPQKLNKLFSSEYSKQRFESLKLLLLDPNVPLESSSCVNSRKVPDHNVPTTVW